MALPSFIRVKDDSVYYNGENDINKIWRINYQKR